MGPMRLSNQQTGSQQTGLPCKIAGTPTYDSSAQSWLGKLKGSPVQRAHLDVWVGVADGAAVMGGDVGDAALSKLLLHHLQQLVCRLLLQSKALSGSSHVFDCNALCHMPWVHRLAALLLQRSSQPIGCLLCMAAKTLWSLWLYLTALSQRSAFLSHAVSSPCNSACRRPNAKQCAPC